MPAVFLLNLPNLNLIIALVCYSFKIPARRQEHEDLNKFSDVQLFVNTYLQWVIETAQNNPTNNDDGPLRPTDDLEKNRLTLEVVHLAQSLARYGDYTFPQLLKLVLQGCLRRV